MELKTLPPEHYLGADEIIESTHPAIVTLGKALRHGNPEDTGFAEAAFTWVRDNVAHAYDIQDHRVTLSASEVLRDRVGLCYAKSHLLTALLRSQAVPAGLCYQRLGAPGGGFFLHGLVALHLHRAWHRQDPRGNKPGVDAQFSLGSERIAYTVDAQLGELDYPCVYTAAAVEVVTALRSAEDILTCPLPSDLAS
jgi:transglutaminase-like putative cysteine protease